MKATKHTFRSQLKDKKTLLMNPATVKAREMVPMTMKVAGTSDRSRISRICGVTSGSGPSSKVSTTSLGLSGSVTGKIISASNPPGGGAKFEIRL